ncbi:MAG: PKD domain-containing protein, partial [Bacteroidales bacterium]|nr:PKD domain-containing protein [Bacteroidales bacterium]
MMKRFVPVILFSLSLLNTVAQRAGFTVSQPSKCAPSTVSFTNTSNGNPTSYLWIFGDGVTSTNPNPPHPTHPYVNAGVYMVQLVASYPNNISDTAVQWIEVLDLPAFSFTKTNDSVCPGGIVSFTSSVSYPSSANGIQSYSWDFGDGGLSSSPNPSHQYMNTPNQPVLYHVSLTITDTNGCSQKITQSNYIYVKPKPIPEFTVDKRYFCIPDTPAVVQFTNQTTVTTNNTYQWLFSDGGSSSAENPVYSFTNVGSYAVGLTVTSSEGCTNTISKSNLVEVIQFNLQRSVSDTILCSAPDEVTFRGQNGSGVDYAWNFGDGTTGNSTYNAITHIYNTSGTYLATVIADYHSGACFAYDTIVIHIYDSIVAEMLITDSIMCDFEFDKPVLFENKTTYPSLDDFGFGSTVWFFGDSTPAATGNSVYHTYNNDTNRYQVTMQITTPYGCTLKEITRDIWYHSFNPPFKKGVYPPLGGCLPLDVSGIYQLHQWDVEIVEAIWDWGDGSPLDTTYPLTGLSSISASALHTYTDTGEFYVLITYTNVIGCKYTDTVGSTKVGIPPAVWFEYEFQEQCYSNFFSKSPLFVHAYDSLDINGEPLAGTYADRWLWLDKNKQPTWMAEVDTAWLRVDDTGYIRISVVPFHNECPGDTITIDSVSYACPPRAGFIAGESDDVLYRIFCDYPVQLDLKNMSVGATAYKWFFGDAEDLINQSTSTDTDPVFSYLQSTPFLFDNGISPGIRVTLVAYNADSVNIYSPTYNRCKFCTDTAILPVFIADGIPDFMCSPNICQGDTVYFLDSGIYNLSLTSWGFGLYVGDPIYQHIADYPLPFDTTHFSITEGYPLVFENMENYTAIMVAENKDFDCKYSDTITFSIYPQSVVSITSSLDGVNFSHRTTDTLCANDNLEFLYYRDASYTASPFDTADIVAWRWKINKDTFSVQNPTVKNTVVGMHDVELHIVNEYGCSTDSVFQDQILVNEITAAFYPSQTEYCNHTEVEFNNLSFISPYDNNKNTKFVCTWDFGDGSPPYTQQGIEKVYHTYHLSSVPNTVNVTLTISTDVGCTDTYLGSVNIMGPKAIFTDEGHRFPCPDQGRTVQFHSTSTGNPVWYYWNFGDSASGTSNESNLKDPIHDYLRAGYYDVIHIVRDATGCMDSVFFPAYVFIDGPVGDFQYGELGGCIDHRVMFIPFVTNADSIIINPDRATPLESGGANINDTLWHTYRTADAYLPYFYLIKWTDNNGTMERCSVQWSGTDTIYAIDMIPDFETDSVYCVSSAVTFPNTTTLIPNYLEPDSVVWSFGNGDSLTAIDGYTKYHAVGRYNV